MILRFIDKNACKMVLPSRSIIHFYDSNRVRIGSALYYKSEILELTNPDAISAINHAERKIKQAKIEYQNLLNELWVQFKK